MLGSKPRSLFFVKFDFATCQFAFENSAATARPLDYVRNYSSGDASGSNDKVGSLDE